MTTLLSLRTVAVLAPMTLALAGGAAGTALASSPPSPSTATVTATSFPDRGIVCPRGQHAFHAPGGAVTCIPNGQLKPTPTPPPAR